MPNGLLDAREQGLLSAPMLAQLGPQGFTGQGATMGAAPLEKIYGLLAQYGDDPAQAGNQYVGAVQNQQQLDRQNQPLEQYLRLYGSVNPFDFETESLQRFHENYVNTGQLNFGMLERKQTAGTQGFLNTAIQGAYKAEQDLGRMNALSSQFDEMARAGVAQGRLAGGFNEWVKGIFGSEDAVTQLRTEYEQLRVSNVIQNLPPGVASDRDVALVLKGWPSGVSDPAYIAAFLRGMQKLRAVEMARRTHEAGWLSRNEDQRGMLQDWETNKLGLIDQAFRSYNLPIWNPGEGISPEDAAQMRWAQQYNTGAGGPPAGGFQIIPGQGGGARSIEDIERAYGLRQ